MEPCRTDSGHRKGFSHDFNRSIEQRHGTISLAKDPQDLNSEILEMCFCRLVFGLQPSPAILGSTITYHLDQFKEKHPESSEIVELIKNSLYVDDFTSGGDCEEKSFTTYQKAKTIMSKGGLNLRKWKSNAKSLLKKIHQFEVDASKPIANANIENNVAEEDQLYVKTSFDRTDRTFRITVEH